ncbi:hypothetical protein EHQ53_12570 [Leptospira langatensis]|uniref:Yip1 domain-containing protein n=1 Tax=Leptospira langatensis TaxID=2484983 RepID=A0A5F1ZR49_9LEPT|nr:hypothetical protein [Leptospira langatensis]TGK02782.1 hypothetical protein EHO57_05540 [Leptospira langatensis]TGL40013.1 hypothetical protein EHQ53_12570 [Leptospira langatensis]
MLKELFFRFIDLLDAVLFEPFRAENVISSWGTNPLRSVWTFILFLSSLSAGAGYVFISPPFTNRSVGQLITAAIAHLIFFLLLPYAVAFITDGYAQSRGRKGNAAIFLHFVRFSLSLFLTAGAWGILLSQFGLKGSFGIVTLYTIHYGFFITVMVRGTSYIYDLKFRDSLVINLTTFLITFFLPLSMYFAIISSFTPAFQ